MSGGGRSQSDTGGVPGVPTNPSEEGDCSELFDRVTLASPVPEVLSALRTNSILSLVQQVQEGPLLAVADTGAVAGSITGAVLGRLLACIDAGYSYVAVVVTINGGRCVVDVRPE